MPKLSPPPKGADKSEWVNHAMAKDPTLASFDAWALTVEELQAHPGPLVPTVQPAKPDHKAASPRPRSN